MPLHTWVQEQKWNTPSSRIESTHHMSGPHLDLQKLNRVHRFHAHPRALSRLTRKNHPSEVVFINQYLFWKIPFLLKNLVVENLKIKLKIFKEFYMKKKCHCTCELPLLLSRILLSFVLVVLKSSVKHHTKFHMSQQETEPENLNYITSEAKQQPVWTIWGTDWMVYLKWQVRNSVVLL